VMCMWHACICGGGVMCVHACACVVCACVVCVCVFVCACLVVNYVHRPYSQM